MNVSRHAATLVVALLLSAMAPKLYAQTTRIAVVDLQRALNETEDGRRAKARLKKLFKQRQDALDQAQEQVKQLKQEYDTQSKVWRAEVRQQKEAELQKAFVDLQSKYMEFQRELAGREAELTREIIARMERILRRIGQAEGYTLIVERSESGVVWVPSHLDLTDRVIQAYNSGEGRDATEGGTAQGGAGGGTSGGAGARATDAGRTKTKRPPTKAAP